MEGDFWCWPCDITQPSSLELLAHLSSPEHLEVEAALNRTLPVIVRKRRDQHCMHPGCGRRFRLNIQLQHHQKSEGHVSQLRCGSCGVTKKTHLSLQRHVIRAHPVDVSKVSASVSSCIRTLTFNDCVAFAGRWPGFLREDSAAVPVRCGGCGAGGGNREDGAQAAPMSALRRSPSQRHGAPDPSGKKTS